MKCNVTGFIKSNLQRESERHVHKEKTESMPYLDLEKHKNQK